MARGKKETTKSNVESWYNNSINEVMLSGVVKKITIETEKCLAFQLETVIKTPKGNYAHQWLPIKSFDTELELNEGDFITINGYMQNNNYEGNNGKVYTFEVIATSYTVGEVSLNK